jgi:hypothetical protein
MPDEGNSTQSDATAPTAGMGTATPMGRAGISSSGGSMVERGLGGRLGIHARTIAIVLGLIWVFDGALQFQPYMFSKSFVNDVILPNAAGQPAPISWFITNVAHFIRPDVGMWNFLFAVLQVTIGAGLLFSRTRRPAIVVMIVWSFGVWAIGEGFGMILTGTASPLMGAPGAVLLYAVIGVLIWPKRQATGPAPALGDQHQPVGVASSAAASGFFGGAAALAAWAVLWVGSAVLWLLPANRAAGSFSSMIRSMASGEPGWYAHFLNSFAGHFASIGPQTAWVLAIASLVIGMGPLVSGRPTPFLAAGSILALAFWVTGGALGGIMTGTATDPNIGLLIVLLALAMLPTVVPVRASEARPIVALLRVSPLTTCGAAAGIFAALLLSATYPVAVSASSAAGPSMAGMSGMAHHQASTSTTTTKPAAKLPAATATATQAMSGMKSMSDSAMAGMAGLEVTKPGWHYTGPALPAAEVALLTSVNAKTDEGHAMQTPNCTTAPTDTQVLGAVQYVQATTAAVAKYQSLSAALAAGYRPVTSLSYPVVHYVNASYMQSRYALDPTHVQSLVYATTPDGPVLVAAMYLMPNRGALGPMPYGCLVQWHAHTNLCTSLSSGLISGFTPCPAGYVHYVTPVMSHVWQVPVAGGPLALDPSDLQVVEAAYEAQMSGQAPINSSAGQTFTSAVAANGSF